MALIIGTVPGYPDLETSFGIIKAIKTGGADILELSASFSDPVADGPKLAKAHQEFLKLGVNKEKMFDFYGKLSATFDMPTFIIEYANVVYKIKPDNYFSKLGKSGIANIVIPDMPLEESHLFKQSMDKNQINQALLISPVTSEKRIKQISESSKIFVYAASVAGVTGVRDSIAASTVEFLKRAGKISNLPIVVGFGINNAEQIKILAQTGVSGVIVCSAIINLINKNLKNKTKMMRELKNYIKTLKSATKKKS